MNIASLNTIFNDVFSPTFKLIFTVATVDTRQALEWFTLKKQKSVRQMGLQPKRKRIASPVNSDSDSEDENAQQPLPKKLKVNTTQNVDSGRPICILGYNCNDKDPLHRSVYAHVGDTDFIVPRYVQATADKQPCPYGARCYRLNIKHQEEFRHWCEFSTEKLKQILILFFSLFQIQFQRKRMQQQLRSQLAKFERLKMEKANEINPNNEMEKYLKFLLTDPILPDTESPFQ